MANISNEEVVQKAVITTDALASAGKLNPAQSAIFLDYVIQESVMKDAARTIRFRNEQLEIDKIGVGKRVAMPHAEAADPQYRRGVNTSKVVLQPRAIMVPFEITDEFKENSIEGDGCEDHIIRMMARQTANDLEQLCINGDTLGQASLETDMFDGGSSTQVVKDTYLALFDGWLRKADSANLVNMAGENVALDVFNKMVLALPTKFRRSRADLRWYMSSDLAQTYYSKIATRATLLGDAVAGGEKHKPFGIEIVEVPLMPLRPVAVQHVTLTGTTAVALRYAPIASVIVTPTTLNKAPTTPFVETTDYVLDTALGTIARTGGGAITSGQTVKVTYLANPQIMLSHRLNWIVGIGRDIRIEKDRDIFKTTNQYAITIKADVQVEELTALVKGFNLGTG